MNYRYKNLLKDTTLFAISSFGSKLLTILLVPLYTSVLSTSEYGTADLILTTVNLLGPLLTVSMSEAVLRFSFNKELEKRKVLCNGLVFVLGSSLLLAAFYPFRSRLTVEIGSYWILFVLVYLMINLQDCIAGYIKGTGKTKLFAIQGIVSTLVFLLSNIVFLVILRFGIEGYLLSLILSNAVAVLVMIVFGNVWRDITFFCIDKVLLKDMLKYSWPLILSTIAWWINTSADKYMISGMISVSENGIYSIAHKIPTLLTTLTGLFSQAWLLSVISSEENDDIKQKSEFFTKVYQNYILFGIYACLAIIAIEKILSKLLFAKEFFVAWKCIPFLLLAALFSAYAGFFAAAFRAEKKTGIMFYSTVMGAVINLVLNYFLIKQFGIVGAALSTMISFAAVWIIRYVFVQKIVKIKCSIFKMIIVHILLIVVAAAFTLDNSIRFIILIVVLGLILAVYYKETLVLFKGIFAMARGVLRKR